MFKDTFKLDEYCDKNQLTSTQKEILARIISSPPARQPTHRRGNVTVNYYSQKDGFVVQAESRTVEFPEIYKLDHDDRVLGIFNQPITVKVNDKSIKDGHERPISYPYTPDLLVIYVDHVVFIECKMVSELEDLSAKNPERYFLDKNGVWHYKPAEIELANLGFQFQIITNMDIDYTLFCNMQFVEDYYKEKTPSVPEERVQSIRDILIKNKGISLFHLIRDHQVKADDIYTMLARNQLYIDLSRSRLEDRDLVSVFADFETGRAFSSVSPSYDPNRPDNPVFIRLNINEQMAWDGQIYRIVNVGATLVTLASEDKKLVELNLAMLRELIQNGRIKGIKLAPSSSSLPEGASEILYSATEWQLAEANKRMRAIQHKISDGVLPRCEMGYSKKSIRNFVKKFRTAEATWGKGTGYIGLIPVAKSGNTKPRHSPEMDLFVRDELIKEYAKPSRPTRSSVKGIINKRLREKGWPEVSNKKIRSILKTLNQHTEVDTPRRGTRGAYRSEPPFLELELTTPRHGDRAFHIGHIDHTELDLELLSSITGKNLGKCYLTILTDARDRCVLAFYISFRPPSYQTDMMVLRECVRRHGRLPAVIVSDGGPDFTSVYYESMLVLLDVTKYERPSAKGRFGSPVERLFGTTNTEFIDNVIGNTQASKNPRELTPETNPKNLTPWTLPTIYDRLSKYFYTVYNKRPHPALGMSPDEFYELGLEFEGLREHTYINFDVDFFFLTLPDVQDRDGMRTLRSSKSITVNNIDYTCEDFFYSEMIGKKLRVKFDPANVGHIFAFHNGKWVECFSMYYKLFKYRSLKEVELISSQILQQKTLHNSVGKKVTERMLADFMEETHDIEQILKQQWKDLDNFVIDNGINSSFHLSIYGYTDDYFGRPTPFSQKPEGPASDPKAPEDQPSQYVPREIRILPDF